MNRIVWFLGMMMSGVPVPGHAADVTPETALDWLSGYEWSPEQRPTGVLGPEPWRILIGISQDSSRPRFIRARAASALVKYPNEEVWQFMVEEIERNADRLRRRQLVQDLCMAFVSVRPGQVRDLLLPLLEDADAHLRIRVAGCVRKLDGENVREALAGYRQRTAGTWEYDAAGFRHGDPR